jgi:chitinase
MFPSAADTSSFSRQLNVNASVGWWISQGASRSKINVGMPAYGRVWTLDNAGNNNVGAPAHNPGLPGPFLNETGFHGYNEICINLSFNGWARRWESLAQVPFAVQGNQWIGYDDLQSISGKMDYIIRENLGGAMWWSIDTEDFRNMCGQGFSPLIRLAMNRMRN